MKNYAKVIISQYGISTVIKFTILAVVLGLCLWVVPVSYTFRYSVVFLLGLVILFLIYFFRDPNRTIPEGDDILAPADGKIISIKEYFEKEYLQQPAVEISIFMSPFDVHVNRFPVSGIVSYFKHIDGGHLVAFHPKSSEKNEHTVIGIETDNYRILLKQIAGLFARRIVAPIKIGQFAHRGERFGMIKFGSQVDIIMPGGFAIQVVLGQRVVAGETVLANKPQ